MGGAGHLGGGRGSQLIRGQLGQRAYRPGARGMHDGGERADPVEQRGQRGPVGHVTRRHRDLGSEVPQLRLQLRCAVGVAPPATGEDHALGTLGGQPPGHVGPQRAGAAGYQDGAARPPGAYRGAFGPGPHQPTSEETGGTYGDLVLTATAEERTDQQLPGVRVEHVRQVDQSAPAPRVLQGRHPAQAPYLRLGGAHRAPGTGGHRPARGAPQRCVDLRELHGLEQQDGTQ